MNGLKRSLEIMYSPETETNSPLSIKSRNKLFKKLQFTVDPIENYDESSCDSGFSEIKDLDDIQSFQEDDARSEADVDLDTFEMDTFNGVFSPCFTLYDKVSKFESKNESSDEIKHLKKKSNTFDYAPLNHEDFNQEEIKEALKFRDDSKELIGDMTRSHTLPTLKNKKHNDLASISSQTMADLLNGQYDNKIGKFLILDARYPYEFEGGHIDGAENAYFKDKIFNTLFENPMQPVDNKPFVIIFHCEFSSERGPRLMREIREKDRMINKHSYPNLFYPEIYLLEGGYKCFYEQFDQLCAPRSYLPMLHENHKNDLKFFRKKSKTWSGPSMATSDSSINSSNISSKAINKRNSKVVQKIHDQVNNSVKKTKLKLSF